MNRFNECPLTVACRTDDYQWLHPVRRLATAQTIVIRPLSLEDAAAWLKRRHGQHFDELPDLQTFLRLEHVYRP